MRKFNASIKNLKNNGTTKDFSSNKQETLKNTGREYPRKEHTHSPPTPSELEIWIVKFTKLTHSED